MAARIRQNDPVITIAQELPKNLIEDLGDVVRDHIQGIPKDKGSFIGEELLNSCVALALIDHLLEWEKSHGHPAAMASIRNINVLPKSTK